MAALGRLCTAVDQRTSELLSDGGGRLLPAAPGRAEAGGGPAEEEAEHEGRKCHSRDRPSDARA
eukprot:9445636-Alexandrium_andersonii.AAC.1